MKHAPTTPIVPEVAPKRRARPFDGFDAFYLNPAAVIGLCLITLSAVTVVFGAAVFFGWLGSVVFQ